MSKKGAQVRTEEDAVLMTPLVVILGGKKYNVKLLCLRESAEWRVTFIDTVGSLPQAVTGTTEAPQDYTAVLKVLLTTMPEKAIELFFAYAKGLEPVRETIMTTANDHEMAIAFKAVFKQAYPLSTALVDAITELSR